MRAARPFQKADFRVTALPRPRRRANGSWQLESTFKDQINPKRQTAGPQRGSPELDLEKLAVRMCRQDSAKAGA